MMRKQKLSEQLSPYVFVLPAAVLLSVFMLYPLISSVYLSMTNWSGLGAKKFIGFENYRRLFTEPIFWNSIKLQIIWALLSVVLLAVSAFFLALIVEIFVPLKQLIPVFRTILFMPMMMSLVCVGLLWSMIFDPMIGILNEVLLKVGILEAGRTLALLADDNLALYAVFIPVIWQWSGFGMVIFSAAMQGIPQDIMEAALIDGCTKYGRIRHIIFPLLKPTIVTVNTINFIGGLKCFDIIYVMTNGGPGNATLVTSIYIFKMGFINNAFGYSAAASFVLFILTALFGFLFFSFNKRLEVYI
jgi:ABC-type sugar transport system permease subunit